MDSHGVAELVEWAGIALPWRAGARRVSTLVVAAFDDFPGQMSAEVLLRASPDDVLRGAALLATAAGGASPWVMAASERCRELEAARDAAPSVRILAAPTLHALSSPRLLAAWLSRQSRFDGADPGDFLVTTAEEAAALGAAARGRHRLERWITVTGAVRRAGTFLVPHGTTVAALVRLAGGRTSQRDVPHLASRGSLRPVGTATGIAPADGAVVVLPGTGVFVRNRAFPLDVALRRIDSVCSRCQLCDDACPVATPDRRGRAVLPAALLDAVRYAGRDDTPAPPLAAVECIACGVCETVCPVGLPVARVATEVADRLAARIAPSGPARPARLVGRETMGRRLGLSPAPAPARDARDEVRKVRLSLGAAEAVGPAGHPVWRGQVVARDAATGGRILAPIGGIVSRAGGTITIRRVREAFA